MSKPIPYALTPAGSSAPLVVVNPRQAWLGRFAFALSLGLQALDRGTFGDAELWINAADFALVNAESFAVVSVRS